MSDQESSSGFWMIIPETIAAVESLYIAISGKSPLVADFVILLAAIFPFYLVYTWLGIGKREKRIDGRLKAARKKAKRISGGKEHG